MADTRIQGFVVADLGNAKGAASISFLTRQGQSVDPAKAANGLRDWTPLLGGAVQVFEKREEADRAAATYGGHSISLDDARRHEDILRAQWDRMSPSNYRGDDLGL